MEDEGERVKEGGVRGKGDGENGGKKRKGRAHT